MVIKEQAARERMNEAGVFRELIGGGLHVPLSLPPAANRGQEFLRPTALDGFSMQPPPWSALVSALIHLNAARRATVGVLRRLLATPPGMGEPNDKPVSRALDRSGCYDPPGGGP